MKSDLHDLSNEEILVHITKGNHIAFNQLYHRYWKKMYSYAYNILNSKELAEDALHEVFTYIWLKRASLDIINVESYLFVALRNACISSIRNSKFTKFDEAVLDDLFYQPEIDKSLAFSDIKRNIEEAVKELPKRCGAIFYLRNYHDYSNEEIAQHFNISRRTVENQLSLALKHLRKSLPHVVTTFLFIFLQ